ncbi:MAG: Rhs element Vgr protein [Paraburkholderia sp.]|nr:MAG: Rhs element Vgr protein [Paraburkholderia sp.]
MSAHLRIELAKVYSVADALGLGRIRVVYADGLTSDWLQLMSPFAGPGYGMFALPQVGAPALVAFATENRTCGYVIGFPWDGKAKPIVEDQQKQPKVWVLQTNGKKKITLDDSEQPSIEITDEKGNVVKIDTSKDAISIVSQGDLSITATKTLTLQGQNVEIKGQQNIKLEASSIDLNAQ